MMTFVSFWHKSSCLIIGVQEIKSAMKKNKVSVNKLFFIKPPLFTKTKKKSLKKMNLLKEKT